MTSTISPARDAAVTVLARVFEADAYASAALNAGIARLGLDPRDAALATELVYGVLRTEGFLDERVAALASRRGWAKDARVRAHMLVAAYSIAFLDRVRVRGRLRGRRRRPGRRGRARRRLRQRRAPQAGRRRAARLATAIAASARLAARRPPPGHRPRRRRGLPRRRPHPPPIGLCLARSEDREAWMATLQEAAPGATIEAGKASPSAILVRGAGDVRRLPGAGAALRSCRRRARRW